MVLKSSTIINYFKITCCNATTALKYCKIITQTMLPLYCSIAVALVIVVVLSFEPQKAAIQALKEKNTSTVPSQWCHHNATVAALSDTTLQSPLCPSMLQSLCCHKSTSITKLSSQQNHCIAHNTSISTMSSLCCHRNAPVTMIQW